MKTLTRALGGSVMVFGLLLIANNAVCGQVRIQDRFANVAGLRLHYLVAGKGDPVLAAWLRREQSHVAAIDDSTGKEPCGDRAGLARLRPIVQADDGLRQEDDGPGYSRLGRITRLSPRDCCWA